MPVSMAFHDYQYICLHPQTTKPRQFLGFLVKLSKNMVYPQEFAVIKVEKIMTWGGLC